MNGMPKILGKNRLIPVAVIDDADSAVPLCRALIAGGINIIEVTLRTEAALACIKRIKRDLPDMIIGAGTVLSAEAVPELVANGATFAVSPGVNTQVIAACKSAELPIIPGVMSPSEIELARSLDLNLLKFFPAEAAGGVAMLKALSGPYGHTGLRFIPTGGINATSMKDYMALACVAAVGGSWFVARDLVNEQRFAAITTLTKQALAALP